MHGSQMVALLTEYRALWEAMRAHVCLEGRAGELAAQIGALRAQAQDSTAEQTRLDAVVRRLVQLRQAEQGDVRCAPTWTPLLMQHSVHHQGYCAAAS